ncbi:protein kinase domain-containing protein [Streptosporangium sp. LJ11]|uniref:protein kinase domain-containing protein n=1 Tax=Streptosporangium sp. LJ11 TaxID=3436927 RepID=UPI003F7A008E
MTDPNLLAGRYRLLERRDRTGTSWRSRDELLQRDVTITGISLPPPGPHRDRLLGRIRAAADFRHPNVITLHDVVSFPDQVWLILESVEGRSVLRTVRAEGPLTSERAAEVGLRVLDAQTAAHGRGVHLLAGPENVLLTPDDRVVVTDFAIFNATDELRDLGAVLFTAVEGQAPHTGPHTGPRPADGTAPAFGGGPGPAAGDTGAADSGPLAPLLEGLLAADPAHRPDATTTRTVLLGLTSRPARSRPDRLLLVAAALALLAVGGTAFWLWPRPAAQPRIAAPAPLPTFFAKAPDPCSLISGEHAGRLYLAPSPSRKDAACHWTAADPTAPDSLRNTLEITVVREPKAALAHATYLRLRSRDVKDTRIVSAPADVPGLGDEAYVYQLSNGHSSVNSVVVLRAGNVVTALQYHRFTVPDAGGRGYAGALRAARWAVESLRGRR